MKEKSLIVLHVIFIVLAYTSPFWLDWRLVGLGALIYWIQLLVFKACIISIAQYGNTETSFVAVCINKLMKIFGKEFSIKRIEVFLNWLPLLFFIMAYLIQGYFRFVPIVRLN